MKRKPIYRTLYKRDFKREFRGIHRSIMVQGGELDRIISMLANDIPLPPKCRDHPLHGEYEGKRECHIRPDLLLIYTLEGDNILWLERLGKITVTKNLNNIRQNYSR